MRGARRATALLVAVVVDDATTATYVMTPLDAIPVLIAGGNPAPRPRDLSRQSGARPGLWALH
ncbi:MAG: hypothetical protein ACRDIY_16235, partial [Chloroflexota bacterium]